MVIPKPDGGERELGIPTVTDRLIQQALLQVLQPLLDPTFSEHSYGFRPGRCALDAVLAAQRYVSSERKVVVEVDLEKFFDRGNHDILIDRLRKRIADRAAIRLVLAYLDAGTLINGVIEKSRCGAPQGGPLSPLLANVLLDEVDRELEYRGHCFVRYADDSNVYVRSHNAGQRVMILLRRLYEKLHLSVNESKSAVASAFGRKFLDFMHFGASMTKSNVRYLRRHKSNSSNVSGSSLAVHVSAVCSRSSTSYVPACWVGKPISSCQKHQVSGVNWTNGCDTDLERFNSSNGNGERRLIANCGLWVRVKKSPRKGM